MTSAAKVLDSKELQGRWNAFSKNYQHYNESATLPAAFLLLTSIGLTSNFGTLSKSTAKNILEVACGPGLGSSLILRFKDDTTSLQSTDLSNEMIELTKKRLGIQEDSNELPEKNFKIQQADAEKLPFDDGKYNRYISNFCLHLVESPIKMLQESLRVLEVGGVAAFSVWGRPENSNQFTIVKQVATEIGIDMTSGSSRSPFHLNDIKKLRQLALDAGFSKVLGGYSFINANVTSGEEYFEIFMSNPDMIAKAANVGNDKLNEWKSGIIKRADEILNSGEFIGSEFAYIICTK